MSFFEQMITSIYKFQSYPRLIMNKMGRVIGYLIIFTLIITLINMFPFAIGYKKLGGITGAIEKYVPDFSIENGRFQCEHIDYSDELMGVKIYIDGNEDADNIEVGNAAAYIIADSSKMIIGNGIQREVIDFNQFVGEKVDKNSIINFFNSKKVKAAVLTIFSITLLFSLVFRTLIGILMLSLVAMLINVCFIHSNSGFTDMIKLAVYARTFPALVLVIMSFGGFAGGTVLYWGLLVTYIYLGLKNIKKQEAVIIAEI